MADFLIEIIKLPEKAAAYIVLLAAFFVFGQVFNNLNRYVSPGEYLGWFLAAAMIVVVLLFFTKATRNWPKIIFDDADSNVDGG